MSTLLLKTIHKIVSFPCVYDISQNLIGAKINRDILRKELGALTPSGDALDVGGGTGLNRPLIPHNWNYCCLDSDSKKTFMPFASK